MENGEEIDSSLHPFDGPLEMELQLHEKSERCEFFSKGKKNGSKSPNQIIIHPPVLKLQKKLYNLEKDLLFLLSVMKLWQL